MSMTNTMPRWVAAMAAVAAAALVGCSSTGRPDPTELKPITPTMSASTAWTLSLGKISFPQEMQFAGGRLFLAADDGTVAAVDPASGRLAWRADIGRKIIAGTGSDGQRAAVVDEDNALVLVQEGKVVWRQPLGTLVVTAPLVAGERVFVVGVDRSVQAFDALDGRRIWSKPRSGDPLTVSQTAVLAPHGNTLLVGQSALLAGLDPTRGETQWELTVSRPRGTNEVERLADLVGPVARDGDTYCMRAFQNGIGCVDAERHTLLWSENTGGTAGVALDPRAVYAADGSDRITARDRQTGSILWTSDSLLYRELGTPAAVAGSAVFSDLDGLLHFFAAADGKPTLRVTTDGSKLAGAPLVVDGMLIVDTRKGSVMAFRLQQGR